MPPEEAASLPGLVDPDDPRPAPPPPPPPSSSEKKEEQQQLSPPPPTQQQLSPPPPTQSPPPPTQQQLSPPPPTQQQLSPPPPTQQQLSPETLRELVLACGREAAAAAAAKGGDRAEASSASRGEAPSAPRGSAPSSSTAATRDRLRGQLGFCFDPMPWAAAAAAIADGGVSAMGRMGRTPEGVARYWEWRDQVCAREYASTADYVRIEIMGCEAAVAGDGRKVAGAPPADAASRIIWRENDFPYNFEAGVEHLNVWAFSALAPRRLESLIEARRPQVDFETLWYVNPAALASIPDVWHAHGEEAEKSFVAEAGMKDLKGHRSVGGMRASI